MRFYGHPFSDKSQTKVISSIFRTLCGWPNKIYLTTSMFLMWTDLGWQCSSDPVASSFSLDLRLGVSSSQNGVLSLEMSGWTWVQGDLPVIWRRRPSVAAMLDRRRRRRPNIAAALGRICRHLDHQPVQMWPSVSGGMFRVWPAVKIKVTSPPAVARAAPMPGQLIPCRPNIEPACGQQSQILRSPYAITAN